MNILYGSTTGISTEGNQFWNEDSPGILGEVDGEDYFGRGVSAGDFNGDGYADLAVGAATEQVGGADHAGVLHVLYGSAGGITADGNQLWSQDSPGIMDEAEDGDVFGDVLATGNLNADGYADLAIGVAGEDVGSLENAGVVQVLYGSAGGITADGNQLWSQGSGGIMDSAEAGDEFGIGLVIGRFDDDAFDDLAAGAPFEVLGHGDQGAVNVIYGSAQGLTSEGNQLWSQDSPGIQGKGEGGDDFGLVLAAGDFNGDGRSDLVAGVPHEALEPLPGGGAVNVIYGSETGLNSSGDQMWTQNSDGINGKAECVLAEDNWCDLFGWSVGSGDFNGDGFAELTVGVPGEDLGAIDQGAVSVIQGSAQGLVSTGDWLWSQDSADIKGTGERSDRFGWTMVGDEFGGGDQDDLVISVAWEGVSGGLGMVNVIYGSGNGLTAVGNQRWSQSTNGVLDDSEPGDLFGLRLTGTGGYPA